MLKRMARLFLITGFAAVSLWLPLSGMSAAGQTAEVCVAPGGEGGCFTTIQDAIDAVDAGRDRTRHGRNIHGEHRHRKGADPARRLR